MQWFLNILGSLDYNSTFSQLECIATPIPWNVIIDIVGRRGKRNAIRPPFCLSAAQTRASIFQLGFDTGRPIMKQWFLSLPQWRNTANFFLTMKKLWGGWRIFEPHEFFFVNISLVWIFLSQTMNILRGTTWREWIFSFNFSLHEYFFGTSPLPLLPISFLMVLP